MRYVIGMALGIMTLAGCAHTSAPPQDDVYSPATSKISKTNESQDPDVMGSEGLASDNFQKRMGFESADFMKR